MLGASLGSRIGPPAPHPIVFTIDGESFELPALDTRTWLDALVREPPGCWMRLIPTFLAGDGPHRLHERLFDPDDPLDLDDVEHVAETVLGEACGINLYPACRLAQSSYGGWLTFQGWCCAAGFDPLAEPIDRTLAAIWGWRLSLCGEKADLVKLDADIWVMPPAKTASGRDREDGPGLWSEEAEAAAFEAAIGAMGNRVRRRAPAP